MKKVILIATVCLPLSICLGNEFTGLWKGILDLGNQKLNVAIDVKESKNELSGYFYSMDQSKNPIAITSIQQNGKRLKFEIKPLNIVFSGNLKQEKIDGTFRQNGMTLPLSLKRSNGNILNGAPKISLPKDTFNALKGKWNGLLKVGGANLRIELYFEKDKNGALEVFLVSPDQASVKIPASYLEVKSSAINMAFDRIGVKIKGEIKADKISAKFQQGVFNDTINFLREN